MSNAPPPAGLPDADRCAAGVVATGRDLEPRELDDPLPVSSRRAFAGCIDAALARAPGEPVGLLLAELDGLPDVSATSGHVLGDALLEMAARRLLALHGSVAPCMARLDGDRLAVLLPALAPGWLPDAAGTLLEALRAPYLLPAGPEAPVDTAAGTADESTRMFTTASIGLCVCPDDGPDGCRLLSAAEVALQTARAAGGNRFVRFRPEMREAALERTRVANMTRAAFLDGRLSLHYQPKIGTLNELVCGFEALIRLDGPQPPFSIARVIEVAELDGFITTLGAWVLTTAARQSRRWREQGLHYPIAVNVSARQLSDPGFLPLLQSLQAEDPQLARYLELEMNETAVTLDARSSGHLFVRLQQMGFAVHVDDFGSGLSSLPVLPRLPVHTLKIDGSLISSLGTRHDTRGIVDALISMAHGLGLHVLAEGVETEGQFEFLRRCGCDAVQGFLFARALPAEQVPGFLQEHERRREGSLQTALD